MTPPRPLEATDLYRRCDAASLSFDSTRELTNHVGTIGQVRAVDAIQLGVELRAHDFNVFVVGAPGTGRHTVAQALVEKQAATGERAHDWCYVHRFDDALKPHVLRLPPGGGALLKRQVDELIDELMTAIPAALDSDEHHALVHEAEHDFQEEQEAKLEDLRKRAETKSVSFLQTPAGFVFGPMRDGEPLSNDQFQELPDEEKEKIKSEVSELQERLQAILKELPRRQKKLHDRTREIVRETTRAVVEPLIHELAQGYVALPDLASYLEAWKDDLLHHTQIFQTSGEEAEGVSAEERREGADVAGQGTILIIPPDGDMAAYLDSLRAMKALAPTAILPGHGPVIDTPEVVLQDYIDHRLDREQQVLYWYGQGHTLAGDIAARIYADRPEVIGIATLQVEAHLEKLSKENRL